VVGRGSVFLHDLVYAKRTSTLEQKSNDNVKLALELPRLSRHQQSVATIAVPASQRLSSSDRRSSSSGGSGEEGVDVIPNALGISAARLSELLSVSEQQAAAVVNPLTELGHDADAEE
jgi:hypothetical protein